MSRKTRLTELEKIEIYIRKSHNHNASPEACFQRNPELEPEACELVRKAIANGEPYDVPCRPCPLKDFDQVPEIDDLSKSAMKFSYYWDHPANEFYRYAMIELILPELSPAEGLPWLDRRMAIWSTMKAIAHEESKRKQREAEKEANKQRKAGPGYIGG